MAGVRLGTGGRKQHRRDQNGHSEEEAREVRPANHDWQLYHRMRPHADGRLR